MPNRIIKESIRTSKSINGITDFQFRLWVYLITYVDDYGRGSADSELLKGFVFPRRKRVSENDIDKSLAELADMGCILLYYVDGESYFCFPNWGEHQRIQTKKSRFPAPENGQPRCPTVVHGEPPPESESESESELESEYETPPISPKGETTIPPEPEEQQLTVQQLFALFWDAYPKKKSKGNAEVWFKRNRPSPQTVRRMIAALDETKRSADWTKDGGKYVPHPATWLNAKGWEDETTPTETLATASFDIADIQALMLRNLEGLP